MSLIFTFLVAGISGWAEEPASPPSSFPKITKKIAKLAPASAVQLVRSKNRIPSTLELVPPVSHPWLQFKNIEDLQYDRSLQGVISFYNSCLKFVDLNKIQSGEYELKIEREL